MYCLSTPKVTQSLHLPLFSLCQAYARAARSENSCSFFCCWLRTFFFFFFLIKLLLWFPKGRDGKGGWWWGRELQRDIIDIFPEAILAQKGPESMLISLKTLSNAALPRSVCYLQTRPRGRNEVCVENPQARSLLLQATFEAQKGTVTWPRSYGPLGPQLGLHTS